MVVRVRVTQECKCELELKCVGVWVRVVKDNSRRETNLDVDSFVGSCKR